MEILPCVPSEEELKEGAEEYARKWATRNAYLSQVMALWSGLSSIVDMFSIANAVENAPFCSANSSTGLMLEEDVAAPSAPPAGVCVPPTRDEEAAMDSYFYLVIAFLILSAFLDLIGNVLLMPAFKQKPSAKKWHGKKYGYYFANLGLVPGFLVLGLGLYSYVRSH